MVFNSLFYATNKFLLDTLRYALEIALFLFLREVTCLSVVQRRHKPTAGLLYKRIESIFSRAEVLPISHPKSLGPFNTIGTPWIGLSQLCTIISGPPNSSLALFWPSMIPCICGMNSNPRSSFLYSIGAIQDHSTVNLQVLTIPSKGNVPVDICSILWYISDCSCSYLLYIVIYMHHVVKLPCTGNSFPHLSEGCDLAMHQATI